MLLTLPACSPSHGDRIVVGSKNFTESFILGELIAQQIESHTHLKVERRFYLAGIYICQQAMLAGRIDVYPEYTGTALTAVLKQSARGDKGRSINESRPNTNGASDSLSGRRSVLMTRLPWRSAAKMRGD